MTVEKMVRKCCFTLHQVGKKTVLSPRHKIDLITHVYKVVVRLHTLVHCSGRCYAH